MDLKKILIFGGAAVVAYKVMGAGKVSKSLQIQFDAKRAYLSQNFHLVTDFNVILINPSPGSITVKSIGGKILYKGQELGIFSYLQPFTISANSKQTIAISTDTTITNIWFAILGAMKKLSRDLEIRTIIYTNLGAVEYSELITF